MNALDAGTPKDADQIYKWINENGPEEEIFPTLITIKQTLGRLFKDWLPKPVMVNLEKDSFKSPLSTAPARLLLRRRSC